jgi:hypothetical protein
MEIEEQFIEAEFNELDEDVGGDFDSQARRLNDNFVVDIDLLKPQLIPNIVKAIESFMREYRFIDYTVTRLNWSMKLLIEDYALSLGVYKEKDITKAYIIKQNIVRFMFVAWRISMRKMMNTNFCEIYFFGSGMLRSLPYVMWKSIVNESPFSISAQLWIFSI